MLKLNIGISSSEQSINDEIAKFKIGIQNNIDYISIISVDKNNVIPLWDKIAFEYNSLKNKTKTIICSVPHYESCIFNESIISTIMRHIKYGVKAMTFHITPFSLINTAINLNYNINSRGGMFLKTDIENGKNENPILTHFDNILKICKDYNIKMFLGTSLRPGIVDLVSDKPNDLVLLELENAVNLYDKAISYGVDCEIETFGHVPSNHFAFYKYILEDRKICTMGPLQTDSVNGFDEINAIVGLVKAIDYGFNISTVCIISKSEHIQIPTIDDDIDAIQKFKVVKHIIGVINRKPENMNIEHKISEAKLLQRTQCSAHINIFGKMNIRSHCNMCGDFCPLEKIYK